MASEKYIDEQLLKYSSKYRRKITSEDPERLLYISEKGIEDKKGFVRTYYSKTFGGAFAGYDNVKEAREFLDKALLPIGFKPYEKYMYDQGIYKYIYDKEEIKIKISVYSTVDELGISVVWLVIERIKVNN